MQYYQDAAENNKELVETIQWLVQDQAFEPEFLTTTIMQYIAAAKKTQAGTRAFIDKTLSAKDIKANDPNL